MFSLHLLLAPLVIGAVPDATKSSTGWVGKIVFAKHFQTQIHTQDAEGKFTPLVYLTGLEYTVQAEQHDRIQLKTRQGEVGWILKRDVVLLDDAVAFFSQRIVNNPGDHDAYNRRAWAWKLKGETEAAIKDLTEAIRLHKDPAFYNNRAIIWNAKKDYDKAIEDYSHAIQLNPQYALPYSNRGIMWNAKKEYDKGIADFTRAIQLDPKFTNAYRNRGVAWHAKKEYEKAIADYSHVLTIDAKSTQALNDRSVSWLARKEYARAVDDCNEALRIDPRNAQAYCNRGLVWDAQKQYDKALTDFAEALRVSPKHVQALIERGGTWSRMKRYDKALADFNQAVRFDPKHAQAGAAAAQFLAACPETKYRDGKRALSLALAAQNEDKDHPAVLQALAAAHAELGQFTEAIRAQEQALQDVTLQNDEPARRRLELYRQKQPYRQE